jgi:hypothetical protein
VRAYERPESLLVEFDVDVVVEVSFSFGLLLLLNVEVEFCWESEHVGTGLVSFWFEPFTCSHVTVEFVPLLFSTGPLVLVDNNSILPLDSLSN